MKILVNYNILFIYRESSIFNRKSTYDWSSYFCIKYYQFLWWFNNSSDLAIKPEGLFQPFVLEIESFADSSLHISLVEVIAGSYMAWRPTVPVFIKWTFLMRNYHVIRCFCCCIHCFSKKYCLNKIFKWFIFPWNNINRLAIH